MAFEAGPNQRRSAKGDASRADRYSAVRPSVAGASVEYTLAIQFPEPKEKSDHCGRLFLLIQGVGSTIGKSSTDTPSTLASRTICWNLQYFIGSPLLL